MLSRVASTLVRQQVRTSNWGARMGARTLFSTASLKKSKRGKAGQYGLVGGAALALGAAIFAGVTTHAHAAAPAPATSTAFKRNEWTAYPLMDKVQLNHNTTLLRFKLPDGVTAGITVASMLSVGFRPAGETAKQNETVTARPYTPTSRTHDQGVIEFVIKAYPAPGGVGGSRGGVGREEAGEEVESKTSARHPTRRGAN